MSRDVEVGTLVSQGGDQTISTDDPRLSVAEVRRRSWLGLEQGELLGGRFQIQELIQSGGMGDVYRATDRVELVDVAVKTLRAGGMGVRRFEREAMHLSKLTHPGIPRYIAHDLRADQGPYLVMEWLDGTTLADRLRDRRIGIGSAINLMTQVGEALAAAHGIGLIHRDINPSNIFLVGGRLDNVRLLDLGVARLTQGELPLTAEGTQIGTPGYMAPEQVEGSIEVNKSADVFALGCVLYELVCGQRAFSAPTIRELLNRILTERPETPSELNHHVHPALEHLILRCLEKAPALRPQSADEYVSALLALPQHEEQAEESNRPSRVGSSVQQVTSVIVLRASNDGLLEKVRQAGKPFGVRVHYGSDSTVVASTQGRGTASDHAVTAARCALSIQRATRVPAMAVATGLFLQTGEVPSGRAFDSALVSLLLKDRGLDAAVGPALWLDENTASLLDSRFEVLQVEQGFLLRGLRDTHEPSRTVLGRRTRCVGRRRELSMLQATLSESFDDGVASSVLITGSPGVGKSRLINEVVRFARRDRSNLEVMRANGEAITSGAPLGVISQAILRACHIKDVDSQALRVSKLRLRLSRSLAPNVLPRVAGFFAELLGINTEEFDTQELRAARRDAVLRGDQIQRALEDWFRAECKVGPILLVLDDFQWGDLSSVKIIDNLLRNLSEAPLVIVCLARPEVHDLFPKLWVRRGITELRLGGVSRRAATSMIEEILGAEVALDVVERVIQRAQGNPFWIEELLRAEKAGQGESVPDRVVLLAQSRIEQLNLIERRVLEAGSVFGRQFSAGGLAAVLAGRFTASQLGDALRELVDSEILLQRDIRTQNTDFSYEYSSGLLRDAAYSLVDGDEREEAHCRAADYLERNGDGERLAIALHFSLGGALDRARPHYLGAAEQALSGDDMANAIACAEEGLSCGAQGIEAAHLHLIHAEASKWRGEHATALSSAKKAIEVAENFGEIWYRALAEAAVAAGKLGQRGLAFDLGGQLLSTEMGKELDARRIALCRVATQISLLGNDELAANLIAAVQIAPGTIEPDPRVLGFWEEARAVHAGATGDPIGRMVSADAGVQHFEFSGDHRNACFLRLSLGFAEVEFGANERAVSSLVEAVRVAERMGLENSIPVGQAQWGRALGRLGRFDEAHKLLEQAASTFDRQKNIRLAGMSRLYLAELALMEGQLQVAEEAALRAVAIHESAPVMRRIGYALLASIYAYQGLSDQALVKAELAIEGLDSGAHLPVGETLVRLGAAEGLWVGGKREQAIELLSREKARVYAVNRTVELSNGVIQGGSWLAAQYLSGCPERAFIVSMDPSNWNPANQAETLIGHLLTRTARSIESEPPDYQDNLVEGTLAQLASIAEELDNAAVHRAIAKSLYSLSSAFQIAVDRKNASFLAFDARASSGVAKILDAKLLTTYLNGVLVADDGALLSTPRTSQFILKLFGLIEPIRQAALETVERAATPIVTSRKKVYQELAPLMARFITILDLEPGTGAVGELVDSLKPGSLDHGGQDLIKEALTSWHEGHKASSPMAKAQLILLGNCLLGLYEQTRLQRHIKLAVETPIQAVFAEALTRRLSGWRKQFLRRLCLRVTRAFAVELGKKWSGVASRFAMILSLPAGRGIGLAGDSPRTRLSIPADLSELSEPKLVAMYQRFDPTWGGSGQADSDNDWSDLRDRMGLLIEVYRSGQQEGALFAPPETR